MTALSKLQCALLLLIVCPISHAFVIRTRGGACKHRSFSIHQLDAVHEKQAHRQESYPKRLDSIKDDPEWSFLDTARIHVQGGNGGNRCIAPPSNNRRDNKRAGKRGKEKEHQRRVGGGGGRGGRGGSVYLVCDDNLSSLVPMRQQIHFKAEKGDNGLGKNKDGPSGDNVYIKTPPGTMVRELHTQKKVAMLHDSGEAVLLARGGRGASKLEEKGEMGEERWLSVELSLAADVGLVGLPNCGKSSLLAVASNARPKIAEYPFTTTSPNLGVCDLPAIFEGGEYPMHSKDVMNDTKSKRGMVLCDLPGLVRGAVQNGAGMGGAFLRHVQLCSVLLHVVDGTGEDPMRDFTTVNNELQASGLAGKPQVVLLNKCGGISKEKRELLLKALVERAGHARIFSCESATTTNVIEVMREVYAITSKQSNTDLRP